MPEDLPVSKTTIIVTGAYSQIGQCLLPLLKEQGYRIIAISRKQQKVSDDAIINVQLDLKSPGRIHEHLQQADCLIHLAPLYTLTDFFSNLLQTSQRIQRVITFSSSSIVGKAESQNSREQQTVERLNQAEQNLKTQCGEHGIHWTIFRPTLIYGANLDQNVTVIADFIKKYHFFPIVGKGVGLRQPVHVNDLAGACLAVLDNPDTYNKTYSMPGGETLSYRDMVARIFQQMGKHPLIIKIPMPVFKLGINMLRLLPRYKFLTTEMAKRINKDLTFSAEEAKHDFGYNPIPFSPKI